MGCEVLKKEDLMAKVEVAAVDKKLEKKAYIKKRVIRKFKSYQAKREEVNQRWVLVDAKDQVLGKGHVLSLQW